MTKMIAKGSKGQTLVEYALIIALISVGLIIALEALQGGVSTTFDDINTPLKAAN